MNAPDLSTLAAGFDHPVFGSQEVFRVALQALSHPALPVDMPIHCAVPRLGHGAAAALLLALLDADVQCWLSPTLAASDAAGWLSFHTGCKLVQAPAQAQFCWVAQGDACPELTALNTGSDTWPEQGATCVIEVQGMQQAASGWTFSGPGIPGQRRLEVAGLPGDFVSQWQASHAGFPRGVDVFLTLPTQLVGLPRTTRLDTV